MPVNFTYFATHHHTLVDTPDASYETVDWQWLCAHAAQPQQYPQDLAPCVIPSSYNAHDARVHAAQRLNGVFNCLVLDIDETHNSKQEIQAALAALNVQQYMMHTTRKATQDALRWHVFIPTQQDIPGHYYFATVATIAEALSNASNIKFDACTRREGQVVYIPFVASFTTHYDYHVQDGQPLDLMPHGVRINEVLSRINDNRFINDVHDKREGPRSWLRYFHQVHTTESLLESYGFVTRNGKDWHHPQIQTSGSYATKLDADGRGWVTASGSVEGYLGAKNGDGFDLYVAFSGQPHAACAAYATGLLETLQDAAVAHGQRLLQTKLAAIEAALEEQRQELQAATPQVDNLEPSDGYNYGEWDYRLGDGIGLQKLVDEIYSLSKKPITQFAIGYALTIMSGICGGRYKFEGETGLNGYHLMVGESGTGKGSAWSAAKRIARAAYDADPSAFVEVFANALPASGQALQTKSFTYQKANQSVVQHKEDAHKLIRAMSGLEANSSLQSVSEVMVNIWDQSKRGGFIGARDAIGEESRGQVVESPALTVAIDTQFQHYRAALGEGAFYDGIGQRLLYFVNESQFEKESVNSVDILRDINPEVVQTLQNIVNNVHAMESQIDSRYACVPVTAGPGVNEELRRVDKWKTAERNRREEAGDNSGSLINRMDVHVTRVASLMAIYENYAAPVVTVAHVRAAEALLNKCYENPLNLKEAGEVGQAKDTRVIEVVKTLSVLAAGDQNRKRNTYKFPQCIAFTREFQNLVPEAALVKQLKKKNCFTDERRLREDVVKEAIKAACLSGEIIAYEPQQLAEMYPAEAVKLSTLQRTCYAWVKSEKPDSDVL